MNIFYIKGHFFTIILFISIVISYQDVDEESASSPVAPGK
ncbi:hypothetical protein CHCC20441_0822 [Bacillus licheniformis]|uniref:Uncharacterized protein n=1 Tax=Bacillus licheniformis TaxID=1402 RepID=A0A8B5YGU1_BACLI|nr:hypothetical protein B4092_2688 [Bacillus licheniformis]TWN16239.1 hypothetical protein CHCC14564_0804 [Bacillus licheniformis LMG 17339]KYC75981.1 hypothetical protein B4090_2667 [Bacillus licheniformis]KYC81298.1 hypothetical protein B4091_3318 [Bacillus licheniformis]KYC97734.1 hypothetical protein B4164_2473 [Bacillus licheniformis]